MSKEVDFSAPPIVEVAVGISFGRLKKLTAPYFGLFWETLSERFPHTEQVPPVLQPGSNVGIQEIPVRCWFLSHGRRRLLQLQNDALVFNWRRGEGDSPGDYPEFSKIYPEFQSYREQLQDFLSSKQLGGLDVIGCELTYVNFVPFSSLEGRFEVPSDVLVDHVRSTAGRYLPEPIGFDWRTFFDFPEGSGTISVHASSASRNDIPNERLIRLEISVKGKPLDSEKSSIDGWFSIAHDKIVRGFQDMTDERMQIEVWGRK